MTQTALKVSGGKLAVDSSALLSIFLEDQMFDTWTCHICGKERPDDKISVHTSKFKHGEDGIEITQNVRYCNDNPDCYMKAKDHSFLDPGQFTLEKDE
jgi:hypothetical protein